MQRQRRETTATTTVETTTAMTIVIVLLLSAKTRILCGVSEAFQAIGTKKYKKV